MARPDGLKRGKASPLCPCKSDVDLFRDSESVVDLNPEITDSAFDLAVTQEQLHCPQITSAAVDECRLGSAQRVRSVEARVEPDAGNPLGDKASVLPGRQASPAPAVAREEELA